MPRTIPELITTLFAGEEITAEEWRRLMRRRPRQRFWPYLLHVPEFDTAKAARQIHAAILHDLRDYTLPQARFRIRELLHLLDEFAAAFEGRRRQQSRGATGAGRSSGESRKLQRADLLAQFDEKKAKAPDADDDDLLRGLLMKTGHAAPTDHDVAKLRRRLNAERHAQRQQRHRPRR